ncbi:MAG: hypothetical protein Q8O76_06275 [Chloroflexota bacterium]|nr:hypothetical protein [Chloroflexota bacterium]
MAYSELMSPRVQVDDAPEAVFELAYRKGWTDGLPIIPPTAERVHRFLAYLGRDGSEVVAEVAPSGGVATVEKIAINAVMAGCLPEYLPVVMAAVQAMAAPEFNLLGIQCTTNPVAPLAIINGPIRKRLDLNSGPNCLGQGWRANATIGRAIRLVLLNIGGGTPGEVDKAVQGMPGKYTFCFAENEEESPWGSLSQERGFAPGVSTVTMVGGQATHNVNCLSTVAREILRLAANAMVTIGNNNMLMGRGEPLVVLTTGHAKLCTEQGLSKAEVKRVLFDYAQVPIAEIRPEALPFPGGGYPNRDGVARPCLRAEDIMVVVAGGPEPYHLTVIPTFGDTVAVTRPIVEPALLQNCHSEERSDEESGRGRQMAR